MTVRRCDIIMPTCGQAEMIKNCVESLIGSSDYPYRLIAIDNGNSPEATSYLKETASSGRLDMILIKPEENLGWIKSINHGLEFSKDSEYVSFQNDDTVFTPGWLDEIVSVFEKDSEIGIVNPEWEKPEGADIKKYASELERKYAGKTIDMDWCRGHCFVVKREVVNKIGGFDPAYIPVYYDDRDYSIKAIEAGYRCVKARGAFVDHVRNVTMKSTMQQEKIAELMDRNGRIFYRRYGHPLRIVFILRSITASKRLLKKMCMDQNKVIVVVRHKDVVPYENTNMKVIKFASVFFSVSALLYLASNRSSKQQKKTDFVFTDDKGFYSLVKIFKGLIPAEIVFKDDLDILEKEAAESVKKIKTKDKESIK
ncbi:MAG: glycosyltransferase family 2 protein [Candidatus Omnitrophota bacterium]